MKNSFALSGIAAAAAVAAILGLGPPPAADGPADGASTAATSYTVDPVHSSVVFRIRHAGVAPFYSRFNGIDGDFALDPDNPAAGSINLTVDAATIDTNSGQRDDHLRSADFFNVKQFPEITFTSTNIESAGSGQFAVTGDLTIHGVTNTITTTVDFAEAKTPQGKRAGIATEFTIKRSDYDMTYGLNQNALGDEVKLFISVEGE